MRVFSVRSCDTLDVWGPFCFFILGHLRDINTVESCHIKAVVEFFSFSGHCWATVIYFKCNYAKHKKTKAFNSCTKMEFEHYNIEWIQIYILPL